MNRNSAVNNGFREAYLITFIGTAFKETELKIYLLLDTIVTFHINFKGCIKHLLTAFSNGCIVKSVFPMCGIKKLQKKIILRKLFICFFMNNFSKRERIISTSARINCQSKMNEMFIFLPDAKNAIFS